jgi:hypothetical protein
MHQSMSAPNNSQIDRKGQSAGTSTEAAQLKKEENDAFAFAIECIRRDARNGFIGSKMAAKAQKAGSPNQTRAMRPGGAIDMAARELDRHFGSRDKTSKDAGGRLGGLLTMI